jgi:hypothetical protein
MCALLLIALACASVSAQQHRAANVSQKLPAPEKIVNDYLKALGGKKRQGAIRDATYDFQLQLKDQAFGEARIEAKTPASMRTDLRFGNGEINAAASARSAWERGLDGNARTLTDAQALSAKLQSALGAGRLVNWKKLNVLARTVGVEQLGDEAAYVVEFSTREGARVRYSFSLASKFLLQTTDEARHTTMRFADYRATANGTIEPHRLELLMNDGQALTLLLQSAQYNTNLSDARFDPPSAETLDVAALLREVEKNQEQVDERLSEYSYTLKSTNREINKSGEVTKETVKIFEVFRLPDGGGFWKLVSEDGVPLSAERAAKQDKQIAEQVAKYERAQEKKEIEKSKGEAAKKKDDDDIEIEDFLRVCEFVSPRRERFRERDAVVFDFRPRAGYKTRNRAEDIVSKLVGIVWIDPVDKQVMRLEAKLASGYKIGGGLVASIRPGSGAAFEQTRLSDGLWLPRFAQVNIGVKLFLVAGKEANLTREYSDYKRSRTDVKDYKLDAPPKP